jgi:MscS family membrane protein
MKAKLALPAVLSLLLAIAIAAPVPAFAQIPGAPAPAADDAAASAADAYGRETPRGALTGLINALGAQDYPRAANYFDLSDAGGGDPAELGAELARRLQIALDSGGELTPYSLLSNEPVGRIDDGLAPEAEAVGALQTEDGETPILLTRSAAEDGAPQLWRISAATVETLQEAETPPAEETAAAEPGFMIAGAPLRDWALLIGFAALTFLVLRLIDASIQFIIGKSVRDKATSPTYRFAQAALPPLSLYLSVIAFYFFADNLGVSIVARQILLRYAGILAWAALAWFAYRLVDAIARLVVTRMQRSLRPQRRQVVSVVTMLRRAAKVAVVAIATVAILDTFGVNVTAGVAALGIGGLAIALGAQKTVENLVGGISVIADRPIQVGDFCKVGDVMGTVEDIGMRSTRIRTNDRTVVTMPNSVFSGLQIENFATRDRYLFNPVISIEYGVTSAELRRGVEVIESTLKEHPKIAEGARARFAKFGDAALVIEVWSYIDTPDFDESLVIRQDLLLRIMERLEQCGLAIAASRTLNVRSDHFLIERPDDADGGADPRTARE